MPKYRVEIAETSCKSVTVEAESEGQAEEIVRKKYFDQEIILDSQDFVEAEFFSTLVGE